MAVFVAEAHSINLVNIAHVAVIIVSCVDLAIHLLLPSQLITEKVDQLVLVALLVTERDGCNGVVGLCLSAVEDFC